MATQQDVLSFSEDIEVFFSENDVVMLDGNDAKVGDIVICAVGGDWTSPCDIGIVKRVRKGTKLPKGHADGEKADVFVLTFAKMKLRGKRSLTGCSCYLCFSLFVCLISFGNHHTLSHY